MNFSHKQQLAANAIKACYNTLIEKQSNVVWEILKAHKTIYQQTHYPPGDIYDKANQCQYYYHSHPSKDNDRVPEHGHFHLFFKEALFPDQPSIATSKKYQDSQGGKDA